MNKKGIFTPTLIILSIVLFVSLNYYLNPMVSGDYRFKFIDILDNEFEVKKELFDNEQVIKYTTYESLEILFNDNICQDWGVCDPTKIYEEEFQKIFDDNLNRNYKVLFDFNDGVEIDASKDFEYEKGNLKIKTKHVFNYNIGFDWNILRQLYEECRDIKSCDEKRECKAECSEDDNFLNFEYSLALEFVKKINFRVSKRGGLFL